MPPPHRMFILDCTNFRIIKDFAQSAIILPIIRYFEIGILVWFTRHVLFLAYVGRFLSDTIILKLSSCMPSNFFCQTEIDLIPFLCQASFVILNDDFLHWLFLAITKGNNKLLDFHWTHNLKITINILFICFPGMSTCATGC